jgi:Zn-dependent peptidase ImmA (M78 family)
LLVQSAAEALPVDVESIAKANGATIFYEQFDDDVSGVLIRDDNQTVIGVQKSQPKERQRFTVAHELGHLLLHAGRPIRVDRSFRINWRRNDVLKSTDVEEIEANAFAARLLMPTAMVYKAHGSNSLEVEDETEIERLAKMFCVSKQAMNFRLNQLYSRSARIK